MNKDKELEEFFLAQQPHFDDNEAFMASLNKRLDAVEYVKQHQEATIRRYKWAMVAAFVVGIISGAITIAFVLSMPAEIPLFTFNAQSVMLLWLSEHSRIIVTTALSLFMGFGVFSIFGNVMDIVNMRRQLVNN
jgi:hypothetical protein